jgi:hypothetical protein
MPTPVAGLAADDDLVMVLVAVVIVVEQFEFRDGRDRLLPI